MNTLVAAPAVLRPNSALPFAENVRSEEETWPFETLASCLKQLNAILQRSWGQSLSGDEYMCVCVCVCVCVCLILLCSRVWPAASGVVQIFALGKDRVCPVLVWYTACVFVWETALLYCMVEVILMRASLWNEAAVAGGLTRSDSRDWWSWLCPYWHSPELSLCLYIAVCQLIERSYIILCTALTWKSVFPSWTVPYNRRGAVRGPEISWTKASMKQLPLSPSLMSL